MMLVMLTLGDARLTMLNGGNFRLDGGAMHGVVPKTHLVQAGLVRRAQPRRVQHALPADRDRATGASWSRPATATSFPPKLKDIYGIDHDRSIADALREVGLEPDAIDTVVMSHLHFDHSGGTTRRTAGGRRSSRCSGGRATSCRRREWEDATHPHERNRASYLPENIFPLGESGLLQIVDGETEIAPGVRVVPTPGHTAGHQSVLLGQPGGPQRLFLGDVVPTAVHTRLPCVMSYDLDPARTVETKRALFQRAIEEDWLLLWGHDRDHDRRPPRPRQGRQLRRPRAHDNV